MHWVDRLDESATHLCRRNDHLHFGQCSSLDVSHRCSLRSLSKLGHPVVKGVEQECRLEAVAGLNLEEVLVQ